MSYKSDPRGSRPVSLVAVHTAEGARTAASLGAYFFQPSVMASSHVGIDAGATLQYVGYDRSAWTLRSGNPISDNAELCGFAHWSRVQWLGTGAVEGCANPRAMLDRTAAWVRSRCLARGIPIRKLTAADVAAGRSGVIAHWDWTIGMHDGSHTDPGSAFPWDYVIGQASQSGGGGSVPAAPVIKFEEYEMDLKAGTNLSRSFAIPPGATQLRVNCPEGQITVHALYFSGDGLPPDNDANPVTPPPFDGRGGGLNPEDPDKTIDRLRPWRPGIPAGATNGSIYWSMDPAHPERTGDLSFR
jgi:hypothetical protein